MARQAARESRARSTTAQDTAVRAGKIESFLVAPPPGWRRRSDHSPGGRAHRCSHLCVSIRDRSAESVGLCSRKPATSKLNRSCAHDSMAGAMGVNAAGGWNAPCHPSLTRRATSDSGLSRVAYVSACLWAESHGRGRCGLLARWGKLGLVCTEHTAVFFGGAPFERAGIIEGFDLGFGSAVAAPVRGRPRSKSGGRRGPFRTSFLAC